MDDYKFRGPQNVTLELKHVVEREYSEYADANTIRKGYTVTDKADGERNLMIVSKNVVYTTSENILKADVIEINITTKDSKIFMYEKEKKVNIKNKNY